MKIACGQGATLPALWVHFIH